MDVSKETLRAEARRHRERLESSEDDLESAAELFFHHIAPPPQAVVSAYWPIGKEFNPYPIIERLLREKRRLALPVVRREERGRELGFVLWDGVSPLSPAAFGTMEPPAGDPELWTEPDVVIVPLLAFDRRGYRLGYGGGYYDATLATMRERKKITAVGLGYAQQACLFNLPTEPHDQRLDWIITPKDAYNFG